MNDYDYILHLEKLIKYMDGRLRNEVLTPEMKDALNKQHIKLYKILEVHMQNSVARAIAKGVTLKEELQRILRVAEEGGI